MKKIITIEPAKQFDDNGVRMTKLRVAAYCRVSSLNIGQLSSFDAQLEHYTSYITSSPEWDFVGVYADEGISGTSKDKRNEFLRLIRDCEEMKIDLILTKSISRFARNTTDCIETVRKLKALGIAVQFEKENINTMSAESELILTILSSIAAEESKSISQNIRWSYQKRAQEGKPFRLTVKILGYEYNEKGEFVIVPDEAKIVKRIFESYVNGKSHGVIAKELMSDGIKTATNKDKWSIAAIKSIITNERYIGDVLTQKSFTSENEKFTRKKNRGEVTQYYIKDHHPPIISRELFEKAQEVLNQRRKQYGIDMNDIEKYNNRYVFSGKAFCGECGCRLTRKITGANHYKKHITWSCAHYSDEKCTTTGIVEEKVHAAFIKLFNTLYCNYDQVLVPFIRDTKKLLALTTENSALANVEKRIDELLEQEHVLLQLETKGYIDNKMFLEQDEAILSELELRRHEYNNISSQILRSNKAVSRTEQLISILKQQNGIIDTFDDRLFESIVDKFIYFKRSTIVFVLYNGLEFTITVFREER